MSRITLLCFMALLGCGDSERRVNPPLRPQGNWVVKTKVTFAEIQAGQSTEIQCSVWDEVGPVPDVALVADISPNTTTITPGPWSSTKADTYLVRCRTENSAAFDPTGVTVTVKPAPPALVATGLAQSTAPAGTEVAVTCTVQDIYGNVITNAGATSVDANSSVLVTTANSAHSVRGSVAGAFKIACRLGTLVDVTPATLTVTVGAAGIADTQVQPAEVAPTEASVVTCTVADSFGNPLSGADTEFAVIPADGSASTNAGLVVTETGFSATRAGDYYVYCSTGGVEDPTPATVAVQPGLPHHWDAEVADEDCYAENKALPFFVSAYDSWNNLLAPGTYSLNAWSTPSGATISSAGGVVVPSEGEYTVWIEVSGPLATDENIAPQSFTVRVDSTPPVFTITSPARASLVQQSGTVVMVMGSVSDAASDIANLTLVGQMVPVTGSTSSVSFAQAFQSRWGFNVITGSAVDSCGNTRTLAQSFLRSASTYTASTSALDAARVPTAVVGRLNQNSIDDGNRNDLDDLASILELMLLDLDFNTLLAPGQIMKDIPLDCPDMSYVTRRDVDSSLMIDWEGPYLKDLYGSAPHLRTTSNGLSLNVAFYDPTGWNNAMDFPLDVKARACGCIWGCEFETDWLSVWAGADTIQVSSKIDLVYSNGMVRATIANPSVETTGLYVDMDCGAVDGLCDLVTEGLYGDDGVLTQVFEDDVTESLELRVVPFLEGLFAGEDGTGFSFGTNITLPAPMSVTLNIATKPDYVQFAAGYGEIGLATQIYPSARHTGKSVLGAGIPQAMGPLKRTSAQPTFNTNYGFGLGLKDDLLNQLLWAVWYGGGLDLSASEIQSFASDVNMTGMQVSLFARLPPVAMPGSGKYEVEFGLGDLYIDATVDVGLLLDLNASHSVHVGLYASAIGGASLDLDPTTNTLLVLTDDDPEVNVEVVVIDDPYYQAAMSDLFEPLVSMVLVKAMSAAVGAFPLPSLKLGALSDALPSNFELVISNGDIERATDAYRLTGSLVPTP